MRTRTDSVIDALKQKLEQQMIIHDFVKEVLEQDSIDEILWSICTNVISKLGLEDCVIYLFDKERKFLIQKAAYGPKSPLAKEIASSITIPLGEGVVGTVAKTGIAEIVNDTTKDPRYIVDDEFRFSEISVPLIQDGKVFGVIDSEHSQKNFFTDYHLQMLETIASLCSTRISYALAHEKLEEHKDQLEQLVRDRTMELEDSIEKLRLSNMSLEKYAHMVSHDLKTPLRNITTFIQLIEQTEYNLGPKSKEYMALVNSAVKTMHTHLESILKSSKE